MMIDTYRSIGHHFAKLDPLYFPQNKDLFGKISPESIAPSSFGFQ
jgi:2-oxoglutarate dehydrogenase complex dehydrogenase (E1) component-like enzyme